MKRILLCLSLAAALGACAMMSPSPAKMEGGVMVGQNGMTLYTFDKDVANSGRSVCVDKCAVNWPPFMAGASASDSGDWTVVTRADGSKQWAYKGKPLYYWIKDTKPGDKTGDNVGGVWHVVR
jgi:predicted lipoprotein with Yx(FWY)xxD motif